MNTQIVIWRNQAIQYICTLRMRYQSMNMFLYQYLDASYQAPISKVDQLQG